MYLKWLSACKIDTLYLHMYTELHYHPTNISVQNLKLFKIVHICDLNTKKLEAKKHILGKVLKSHISLQHSATLWSFIHFYLLKGYVCDISFRTKESNYNLQIVSIWVGAFFFSFFFCLCYFNPVVTNLVPEDLEYFRVITWPAKQCSYSDQMVKWAGW